MKISPEAKSKEAKSIHISPYVIPGGRMMYVLALIVLCPKKYTSILLLSVNNSQRRWDQNRPKQEHTVENYSSVRRRRENSRVDNQGKIKNV